jgi:hypothetical protein
VPVITPLLPTRGSEAYSGEAEGRPPLGSSALSYLSRSLCWYLCGTGQRSLRRASASIMRSVSAFHLRSSRMTPPVVRDRRAEEGRLLRRDHPVDQLAAVHRILPARKPRPSGRGGAPISVVECPRLELITRSATKAGDNQARRALQPSKRRWCWTGRLPRSMAGR